MSDKSKDETKDEIKEDTQKEAPEKKETKTARKEKKDKKQDSKAEEYLLMAQRIQADFDNYRKRTAATRADAFDDGKFDAIKAFLPVLDNLERALTQERAQGAQGSLMEGLELVLKQMQQALADLGVEEIDALGKPFSPELHEAVMQVPAAEGQQKGEVAAVFVKGYKIKDKVIRYSTVQVTV